MEKTREDYEQLFDSITTAYTASGAKMTDWEKEKFVCCYEYFLMNDKLTPLQIEKFMKPIYEKGVKMVQLKEKMKKFS